MKQRLRAFFLLAATCASAAAAQTSKPLDLTLGYNYAYSDEGGGFANLNGWYGSLNWEYFKRVGLSVEHESFWGQYQGGGVNQHAWLGGVTWKLRPGNPKVSPFLQPMGGATRSSSASSVEQQPTFQLSAGADITLKGNLSLEVIPAEYMLTHGSGQYLHTYEAAGGLQYAFGK
jgi:hypothetical protein